MRVAVVGAAGFLGSAVVAALTEQGHTVRGLVRSAAQSERISRLGAAPVRGDLVSGRGLAELLEGCEAAVHLAQAAEGDLEDRRRVRVEGGRRLVAAAGTAGVRRIVIGSGYWVYRSSPEPIVEDSPIDPRSISLVNFETEQVAREAASRERFEVVYVRPGMVYGDGSWFGEMVRELRAGTYRHLGDGSNFMSPIHLADAASAFGAILERGAPGATYLAVDEAPVRVHDFASFVAGQLGAPAPGALDPADALREWGEDLVILESASRRASAERLRSLGWRARFPRYVQGVPDVLRRMTA